MGGRPREIFAPVMDRKELLSYGNILRRVDLERLRTLYAEQLTLCGMDGSRLPKAREVQKLVQLWKELKRRSKPGVSEGR